MALSRVVGIDQGTMQVLEKHRLAQEADRSLAGPEWVVSDLLFTSQLGQVIHPDTFTWLMHKLITAHNEPKTLARRNHPSELLPPPARELPLIRLHDLRHLRATLFLVRRVAFDATWGSIRRIAKPLWLLGFGFRVGPLDDVVVIDTPSDLR